MVILSDEYFCQLKEKGLIDTDSGHNLIPRLQKNSSPRAPSLRWTRIKMERFVGISSSFPYFLFSGDPWRIYYSDSCTWTIQQDAHPQDHWHLCWGWINSFEKTQKWNITCTDKVCEWQMLFVWDPSLSHILVKLGFLCFWAGRASLVFLSPVFKHPHLLSEARGKKMRKTDTSSREKSW